MQIISPLKSADLNGVLGDGIDNTAIHSIEPVFRILGERELFLNTTGWSSEAGMFMAYRAARVPGDLLNHVQRIYHEVGQGSSAGAYGALLDLFIVLSERGKPLRSRMLQFSKDLLSGNSYQQLHQRLDRGLTEFDVMPLSGTSMLSRGCTGSHRVVIKTGKRTVAESDPLQEARSHMEYGQLEAACSVLEAAVLKGSLRSEIHEDLIEIYIRTHDKANFLKIQRQLNSEGSSGTVLSLWREFEAFFKNGD